MSKDNARRLLLILSTWLLLGGLVCLSQAQVPMTGAGKGVPGGGGGEQTVLIDTAAVSAPSGAGVTSKIFNNGADFNLDLGSGPNGTSNRVLGIMLYFCQTGGGVSSNPSLAWNAVSMNNIGHVTGVLGGDVYFFGLVNPDLGTQDVTASWTTGNQVALGFLSVVNADQTGSTTTFANLNTATGTLSVSSVGVTSLASRIAMGGFSNPAANYTSPGAGNTDIGHIDSCTGQAVAANYDTGHANPTLSYSPSVSAWSAIGVSIKGAP